MELEAEGLEEEEEEEDEAAAAAAMRGDEDAPVLVEDPTSSLQSLSRTPDVVLILEDLCLP